MNEISSSETATKIPLLPYSKLVGQADLKLALELAFVVPRIGGVLISGERGTGKSTAVRSFASMVYKGNLPVTLPINATEDRVVGGWRIDELMRGEAVKQPGLLEEANEKLLYVDEINLLDDHIVNIILDVTSTGILVVQRENQGDDLKVSFTLVGTMNPEEGWLRPQLRDRFGLMVRVKAEQDPIQRAEILKTVFAFDAARHNLRQGQSSEFLEQGQAADKERFAELLAAQERLPKVGGVDEMMSLAVELAAAFQAAGHRGEYVIAQAARGLAALMKDDEVTVNHLKRVAPLALQHRRPEAAQGDRALWSDEDDKKVDKILGIKGNG